jgi:hypothetical protein
MGVKGRWKHAAKTRLVQNNKCMLEAFVLKAKSSLASCANCKLFAFHSKILTFYKVFLDFLQIDEEFLKQWEN